MNGGSDCERRKVPYLFAVSSGFLIKHYYDSARQAEMYDNLIEVVETEPEETQEPMNYSEEKTFIPEYAETDDDFTAYVERCKELSLYDTGVTAEYGDKLLTLSTCEYSRTNGRLVVVAKLINE